MKHNALFDAPDNHPEHAPDALPGTTAAPKTSSSGRFWVGALIAALFAQGHGGSAATTNTLPLSVRVSPENIAVGIPAGCTTCLVEVQLEGKTNWLRWRTYTLNGKPTSVSLVPPKGSLISKWRATGSINPDKAKAFAKKQKFPDSFYQGTRLFAKTPALGYQSTASASTSGWIAPAPGTPLSASVKVADSSSTPKTVEADIWKTDGSTVYFFNQLRGLQVLDLTDPAAPKLNATFRLPALGQDLYLLPEQTPGERLLTLLTRDYRSGSPQTDIVVIKVAGKTATEVSRSTVNGWLSDSRMAGNRLYTVTTDWSWNTMASDTDANTANTSLTEVLFQPDGSQTIKSAQKIAGTSSSALISAGNDWLAVSSAHWSAWNKTNITLFHLDASGASPLTPTPISVDGSINDKFKVSFDADVLSVVSVHYDTSTSPWRWTPVSTLENFTVAGNKLGSLEIIRDEQLFATRFTSGKLYAVTFKQIDPLWVIDLADSAAPKIAGHVEVPGFSTYIEPMGEKGEFLFTIGQDSGRVAASLFDVSDITHPTLKSRVFTEENRWGYSEATYDEKALKVLPEDGLALIPFTGYQWSGSILRADAKSTEKAPAEKSSFVRLVDISLLNGGSLTLRGRLDHDFAPRRATLINGVLASISQKELITADITDRDKPSVLADVLLAWPVNQVIQSGDYLLQISDGSSATWSGEKAAIRVSKTSSDATILSDIELGEGIVQEATLRSNKLYVLRKNWNPSSYGWGLRLANIQSGTQTDKSELALDIYDASALPNLPLLGSTSVNLTAAETDCTISNLLWVTESTPVVVTQTRPIQYWGGPIMMYAQAATLNKLAVSPALLAPNRPAKPQPAVARAFDVSKPSAPTSLSQTKISSTAATMVATTAAGDGLLVFGYGENPTPWSRKKLRSEEEKPALSCVHRLGVLDFTFPRTPILRTPVLLPGRLFAVGDVSRSGFLAYTESLTDAAGNENRSVQISLIDELQAALITSAPVGDNAVLTADGRNLFVADQQTLKRLTLDDSAGLNQSGTVQTEWTPTELLARGPSVLGANGERLLRASWPGLEGVLETWQLRQWFQLSKMASGLDRTIYAPMGDYGVERFEAK